MQDLINELLENALANGYDFSEAPAIEAAEDMARFSAEVENKEPTDLVPYIELWQRQRKK